MAEKPAKKTPSARVAKVAVKKTPKREVTLLSAESATTKKRSVSAAKPKKKAITDDERRQEVAQRVVRRIFDEIGLPEAVRVKVTAKSASLNQKPAQPAVSKATQSTDDADEVVLPSNASPRVLSKAAALKQWYYGRFPGYVARGATGLGVVFLFFGGLGVTQFTATHFPPWHAVQTAVLCGAVECAPVVPIPQPGTTESTSGTAPTSAAGVPLAKDTPSPAIQFIAKPPERLESPTTLVVRAEHVSSLEVVAQSRATSKSIALRASGEAVGPDRTFELSPNQFDSGEYDIRVRAVAARDGKLVYVTGPRFTVPKRNAEVHTVATTTVTTETSQNRPSVSAPIDTESLLKKPTTSMLVLPEQGVVTPQDAQPALAVTRPEPGVALFSLVAPEALSVELYAQRSNASAPYFLASARKLDDGVWQHRLQMSKLPAGNYSITARIKTPSGTQTARGVVIDSVTPPTPADATATTTPVRQATIDTAKALQELKDSDNPPPSRTEYGLPADFTPPGIKPSETQKPRPVAASSESEMPAAVSDEVITIVRERFEDDERDINDLLKRYASAYQSGDTALKGMVVSELSRKRTEMVEEAIQEGETSVTATDLDASIANEFTRLKDRVETFESLLRDRSGSSASIDSDNDGVTDYDEETLYDTDPTRSDSDSDGIPDGAEIMRGFDPRNSAAETLLTFASPKEFGLVRDDVLKIETITPVIETDTTLGQPSIQAEIRGRALPNSFVTLFIFSSPVIVTVKTDADGSFVYQFDKELEDGSHEVYVAVTDNTGDIIAKSSAFSFIKQAEAFTIVDAEAAPVTENAEAPTASVKELYNMVLAMGVLAFGLILLIFGIVMRREPVVTETTPANPASS